MAKRKSPRQHVVGAYKRKGHEVRRHFRGKGAAEQKKKIPMASYLNVSHSPRYELARDMIEAEISESPKIVMESMGWLSNPKFGKLPVSAFQYIRTNIDFTTDDVRNLADILDDEHIDDVMEAHENNEVEDYLANLVADKYVKLVNKWKRTKGKSKRISLDLDRSVSEFGGGGGGVRGGQSYLIGTASTKMLVGPNPAPTPIKVYNGPWIGPPVPIRQLTPQQQFLLKSQQQERLGHLR